MIASTDLSLVLGMTESVCPACRNVVPAKIMSDGQDVYFRKFCPEHGETISLVRRDLDDYIKTQRFFKPAWIPREFGGDQKQVCPDGCGFCERHEQHLCMPIVEITSRCNLACPVCINASGADGHDMSAAEYDSILQNLVRSEKQIDVLNISGGEPLMHPRLLELLDTTALFPDIVRVSISTNGLLLLEKPELVDELKARNIVVSLQLDGFTDHPYEILRGVPLADRKREILNILEDADISTSLTMTAARGVNDDQFSPILDYVFSHDHIISLMIQPIAFAGRGSGFDPDEARITIPDITKLLGEAGNDWVQTDDFVPLPCSHPLCFSLAYYLMLENGGAVSVNRLVNADTMMDSIANRVVFGLDAEEYGRLQEMIYDLWSGPKAMVPETREVLASLRSILTEMQRASTCGCFNVQQAFTMAERKVKSIFIHAFQDADTFDLSRVRHCCQAYPQPDGTLIPACAHNVLKRAGLQKGKA